MAQLDEATKLAIIPTVVLPFTVLGMIFASIATWIAALFGVELKAEGPKKLFEVLMKPKVLISGFILNLLIYGAVQGGQYIYNGPYPLWWVKLKNSNPSVTNVNYQATSAIKGAALSEATTKQISSIQVVWELKTNELIFGAPQMLGTSLFTGTGRGRVLEIDAELGQKLREFEVGKAVMTSPVFVNGKIYVGEGIHTTHHARLYSFDLKEGAFVKAFQTTGHIERAAFVVRVEQQHLLVTPAGKDGIYAVNAETMEQIWHALVGHVDSTPIADEERVYGGTGLEMGFEETPTKIFALDIKTGALVWERALPTSVWSIPVLWKDYVCFGIGDVYKNTRYGQLNCLDKKTGKDYFAFNTTGAIISQAAVLGDHLIVADLHGKIYQFDLQKKALEWEISVPTKGYNYASVVVDGNNHIILPGEEGLYVFQRNDQKQIYLWKPEEKWPGTFTNIVQYKNLWILADRAGTLRALRPLF